MSIKSLHGHSKEKEGSVDGSPKYGLGAKLQKLKTHAEYLTEQNALIYNVTKISPVLT